MTRRYSSISVQTTLATSISNTALSCMVATGTASTLLGGISLTAGDVDQFKIIIDPDTASKEIMYVTGVTSDALTIARGKDGTSAVAHTGGAVIKHVLTGEDLTYFTTGVVPTSNLATGLPFPGSTSGTATVKAPAVAGTTVQTLPGVTGTLMSAESVDSATSKATPVDADELPLADSAASFGLKKLTFANLKAAVFTAIGALTGKTTPVGADTFAISDSAASGVGKSVTWTNILATALTYFNTKFSRASFRTQVTANSTLILTVADNEIQEFTGTTAGQVVQEADVTTLFIGFTRRISNKSTQSIAVNSSGGNLIATVPAGTDWLFTCNAITGTTAASWSNSYAGASAVPSSGKVLQVVQGTYATTVSSASSTYVTTNVTATITPSSASSKILVLVSLAGLSKSAVDALNRLSLRLYRGGASILQIGDALMYSNSSTLIEMGFSYQYLDSPATASAVTYAVYMANTGGAGNVFINNLTDSQVTSSIILIEVGP